MTYLTIDKCVGNTPLIKLQRLNPNSSNHILLKLEGNNPAGSIKDRAAINMINCAEQNGIIKKGDTLIEATSGNTGIALAMAAAIKGYKMILIMPDNFTAERKQAMSAYGAQLIEVKAELGMEGARDLALKMQEQGQGLVLNQFANQHNPLAHYENTAHEIWTQTTGKITHFVSAMGTTGTIMGCSRYLKQQNEQIKIIGLQPAIGSQIIGIRRWSDDYLPEIYDSSRVDQIIDIYQIDAENMTRKLAKTEGIFCGVSSGGAVHAAIELSNKLNDATIVVIICDRGDRYLSSGLFAS